MNLDFKKFKKVASDAHSTTMQHSDGHIIKIAHAALTPKVRSQLHALPYSDGGEVKSKGPYVDPQKAKEMQEGATQSGFQPAKWVQNVKEGLGISASNNPKLDESKKEPTRNMADGGEVDKTKSANPNDKSAAEQAQESLRKAFKFPDSKDAQPAPKMMDDGGMATNEEPAQEVMLPDVAPPSQAPLDITPAPDAEIPVSADQAVGPPPPPAAAEQTPEANTTQEAAPADQQQMPSILGGYNQKLQGIEAQAAAQGNLGEAQAAIQKGAVDKAVQQVEDYKQSFANLDKERLAHIEDMKKGFVDPEKYWDNHSKIATGLGIILAGFNPTNHPNAALEFLNKQIDRSVQAQAQNLNAKHNLLAANMQQFGNVRDATNMTKVMMNDVAAHQIDEAAAKSQNPMAQAIALKLKGDLQMQSEPMMRQLAMQQALIKAQQGAAAGNGDQTEAILPYLRVTNPAAAKDIEDHYVPGVGTSKIKITDKVREELQGRQSLQDQVHNLRTWASKHSGDVNPADMAYGKALAAQVQDQYRRANGQGVFREAEADFVKGIVADDPTAFLNKYRNDPKYKALEEGNLMALNGIKKAYGLPQAKTGVELTPAQQSFAAHAQQVLQKNPNDEKALMVLKKLGLK